MNLQLKSKKLLIIISFLIISLLCCIYIILIAKESPFSVLDYQIIDLFFKKIINNNYGPKVSPEIKYLVMTDDSYKFFKRNHIERSDLAKVNDILFDSGAKAVAYDLIFSYPSNPESDKIFTSSIKRLGCAFLPIGFGVDRSNGKAEKPFKWDERISYLRLKNEYLHKPEEKGKSYPFYAVKAITQLDEFSEAASNSGHIVASADDDGVYRHSIMLIKIDDKYFPSLALSLFLSTVRVSPDEIIVNWGHEITIPRTKKSLLDHDVIIPIDNSGRTFIPYPQVWDKCFDKMGIHSLLRIFADENKKGSLEKFFEGKYVFIGDVSSGISDLGQTTLEDNVPLIIVHTALLNGFLTNTFYREWGLVNVLTAIFFISLILGVAAIPKQSGFLYMAGFFLFAGLIAYAWILLKNFQIFPIVTIMSSSFLIFFSLVIGIQVVTAREQAFIKEAFSRYVPGKVVNELLKNPLMLKLGGEERTITILFSDLEGFTTISEKMKPTELVSLLNEYLTEMTNIVLSEGGIIDKYQGDAIMAEFGAPIAVKDHADMAVRTGLKMQHRLLEMREKWKKIGLPELKCRIGINTGNVIVGNIGSNQVFDYTAIGDDVNLASRLEGANKSYGTYFMISESTRNCLKSDSFRTRVLDVIKVKGKSKAVKVFEVFGDTSEEINQNDLLYYLTYQKAFESYLAKDFASAQEHFSKALNLRPLDKASIQMIKRIDSIKSIVLDDNWDGSIALESK